MWRTALLLGGRLRKPPTAALRARASAQSRTANTAADVKRKRENLAMQHFMQMISGARQIRQRQLRRAIKVAKAKKAAEPVVTRRDERYSKNRTRATAELAAVEKEVAKAALKARKQAAVAEATGKTKAAISAQAAKKKIERQVRKARNKESEEVAAELFFKELQKLRVKRETRMRELVVKGMAKKAREDAEEASKAVLPEPVAEPSPEKEVAAVTASPTAPPPPTQGKKRTHSPTPKKKAAAAKPPVAKPTPAPPAVVEAAVEDVEEKPEEPVPPPKAAAPPPRQRRPATPPPAAVATAVDEVADVHDEFVAQLEKEKDRAAAVPATARAPPPPASAAAPAKSWTMPENPTGLFRL